MKYNNIEQGIFLNRPNRFIAEVLIGEDKHTVHVKNTGRCKELLIKGANVWLEKSSNPLRKTAYDLVCVEKKTDNKSVIINMDSQIVNDVAEEWLKNGNLFSKEALIKREVKYKNSRFDFYIESEERKIFLEVKGVTLENNGVARFPDAPTERGIKHINELITAMVDGYEAYILFVIQMKGIKYFEPNDVTHKAFGDALRNAKEKGVNIIAMDCEVTPEEIVIDKEIEIRV
ncbi:MAG: DNA/RNA nuclease SfsA [Clostridia bacterium]|nr:DNA/RNA nuclease SfsA [Clostridia bacterium]